MPTDSIDLTKVKMSLAQVFILLGLVIGATGMWAVVVYQIGETGRDVASIKATLPSLARETEVEALSGRVRILEDKALTEGGK